MKIKLIAPEQNEPTNISSAETFKIHRTSLPLIAALTPERHQVKIVDESFVPDDFDEEVDLVGITVMTELAGRAYHIADEYRRRGVKVVLGGIHPTVMTEEALLHADAVVVGEAEVVWGELLKDATAGIMHRIYTAHRLSDLAGLPHPRRDLYPSPSNRGYTPVAVGVEASRGCPYDCEFCSIGHVMGHRYRIRPVQTVVAEVEKISSQHLFFVDDALGLDQKASKALFQEMTPLNKLWVGQGTISLAKDAEFLKLMRRSGCMGLLVGFESVQSQTQSGMRKLGRGKADYADAMRRFHDEGLFILGSFVFGFDHEDRGVFEQTYEFVVKNHIDGVQLRIMVPFPGTRLYERLSNEERLFATDWWLKGYNSDTLLFRPTGMTPDELIDGFSRLNRELYSWGGIIRRFMGMSLQKRTAFGARLYAGFNIATRRRYFRSLETMQPFGGNINRAKPARATV